LNGDVGEVEFFGNTGAGDDVYYGEAFFIGGHIKSELALVYKRDFVSFRVLLACKWSCLTQLEADTFVAQLAHEGASARQFNRLAGVLGVACERHHAPAAPGAG